MFSLSGLPSPILTVFCLLLALSPEAAAARFWGQVSGNTGAPVAWPVIRILDGPAVVGDSRGYFAFEEVSPGTLRLLIEAPGYLPLRVDHRYLREGASEFRLTPRTQGDLFPTTRDLLQQPEVSATGTQPGRTAALQRLDRDGDGLVESLASTDGGAPDLLLDGQPLVGLGQPVLLGLDRLLWQQLPAGQFQTGAQPAGLFRREAEGALWLATPRGESRGTSERLEPTPFWQPRGGVLILGQGSRGSRTADARLDMRPLPQDPLRVRLVWDLHPGDTGLGARGDNRTRGLQLQHQHALRLGLLETDGQLDRWTNRAPLWDRREEWLLDTGRARETGSRARFGLRWRADLAKDLSLRVDLQTQRQVRELQRMELDRLYQRGVTVTDYQASGWFDTRRERRSERLAAAVTADWKHPRGRFRMALWLEHLGEDHTGQLPAGSGWTPWYDTAESHWASGLRLADRYALWGPVRIDLDVCARYRSYVFERRATAAWGNTGALEFDDNLLVLEPRLALVLEEPGRSWTLAWSRFNPMLDPLDYWDLYRAPTSAYSEPLFVEDADGLAVPRLRTPRSERLELGLEQRQGQSRGGITVAATRARDATGAWYKPDGQNLPDPQWSNGGVQERLEATLWLESRLHPRTRLDAGLHLAAGRWREAQLVLPLEDSPLDGIGLPLSAPVGALYYGPAGRYRLRDLDHRPAGLSACALTLRLEQGLRLPVSGDLSLVAEWESRTPAPADHSGQAGLTAPGVQLLGLSTRWQLDRWAGWQLELAGHNLLDQAWQGEARVIRSREGEPARLDLLPAASRAWELKLVRSW